MKLSIYEYDNGELAVYLAHTKSFFFNVAQHDNIVNVYFLLVLYHNMSWNVRHIIKREKKIAERDTAKRKLYVVLGLNAVIQHAVERLVLTVLSSWLYRRDMLYVVLLKFLMIKAKLQFVEKKKEKKGEEGLEDMTS